jgi:hypothetical protein
MRIFFFILAWAAVAAHAQTKVNLQYQATGVDFSNATFTKPAKSGTVLPAVCSVGEAFFQTNGVPGQNLYFCTSTNIWSLEGGGGSGGVAQLPNVLPVSRNGSTLTVGAGCTVNTPCNVRVGAAVYSFNASSTVTLNSGTGTAYIFLSAAGSLTVGHNMNVTCGGGCVAQAGVTAFPFDSVPIAIWTASSGTWNGAGTDTRGFLGRDVVYAGMGLASANGGGNTVIRIDPTVVGLITAPPLTSSSSCSVGFWAADASFYYTCVSPNTWRRVALASW